MLNIDLITEDFNLETGNIVVIEFSKSVNQEEMKEKSACSEKEDHLTRFREEVRRSETQSARISEVPR